MSRQASDSSTSRSGSTAAAGGPEVRNAGPVVASRIASTRPRSRAGNTWVNRASARTDASAIPSTGTEVAVRKATARATASSSSQSSGGNAAPAASRYPPAAPGAACTG